MDNTIRIIFKARNNILLSKREEMGYTQLEMAKYCDVSVSAYGAAERLDYEHFEATEKNLIKISETLEIEFDKLFPRWASMVGKTINSPNNYLLLDDEYAKQKLLPMDEFGGSPKLLQESFVCDLQTIMNEQLTERESKIVKHYFGVCGFEPLTLEEIGNKYNLTRERVRQIKERSLRRMRWGTNKDLLKSYMNSHFEQSE